MSEFDKWFESNFKDLHKSILCGDLVAKKYKRSIKKTWNYQQKKIDEKQKHIDHLHSLMGDAADLIREGNDSDALELLK